MARYNDHVQYDAHIVYNEGVTGSNYAAAGTVAATSALSGAVTSNLVASASTAGVSSLTGAVTANRVASGTVAGVSGVRGKVPPQRPVTARWVILGDSTTYRSGTTSSPPSRESVTRAVFATVGFDDAKGYWYGVGGKRMLVADSGGKTTPTNITDAQTALGPVDVWVIGLGTNDVSLSTTDFETAVNTLLDDVAAAGGGFVLWVNLAFYNVANTNAATFNPVLATVAAARPSEMRVLDFNTYIHGGGVYDAADWIYPTDSTHMTVQGWAKRDAYIKAAVLEQIHSYEVAGTNAAVSGVTGNMSLPTANYAAAGTVAATTAVTGAVTVNGGVSGTVAGTTTVTGNAVRARSAAGTCAVATTVTGTVAVRSPAAGSVAAVTMVTSPTLALGAAVAGQCAAITAASGTVGLDIPISGTVAAEAAAVPGDTIADLQAAGAVAVLVELVGSPTITPRDLVIVTVVEVPNRVAVFVEVPERSATFEEV